MKTIIVYDTACCGSDHTADLVQDTADKLGIAVNVTRETDYAKIAMAGVISTPGIAIDGKLVHTGSKPDVKALEGWLAT